jgi:cyclopropane-fatty-acyl-phospholipid synthase
MDRLLDRLLRRIVRTGNLTLSDAQGTPHRYGNGAGLPVHARIADRWLEWRLLLDPFLALGEGYMSGRLGVECGRIYDLLALLARNIERQPLPRWTAACDRLRFLLRRILQFNPAQRARRNVAHHYDIDSAIYDLFLDRDRQYSCGYFTHGEDLDEAQRAKKRHIAAKLALRPGLRVLDIGSGWGGLGIYLAKCASVDVTGVTLSREQLSISNQRAAKEGLQRCVRFDFKDYREVCGRFDRIISVGMFEHVGIITPRIFGSSTICSRTTALPSSTLSGGRGRRRRPIPSSLNTSSPEAISRHFQKCCQPSSGPA